MLPVSDPSRLFYQCYYSWNSNWEGKGGGTTVVAYIIEEKVTRLMSNCAVWKWVQDNAICYFAAKQAWEKNWAYYWPYT